MRPVLFYANDGYLLTGPKLMGRHSAGNGFLRAAIQAATPEAPLTVAVQTAKDERGFRDFLEQTAPQTPHQVISCRRIDLLAKAGLYFRPDVVLIPEARRRLWMGPAAYALCGVTHTMATDTVQDILARLPFEPLMPWDSIICTSTAALAVAERVLDEAEAQHRWRTRSQTSAPRPMLPIIPLGVHCADYAFTAADRAAARAELALDDETVAILAPGRISLNAKAHPYPMMKAVQDAAVRTGRRLTLVLAGQAEAAALVDMYRRAAAQFCPDVQTIFVDGADAARFRRTWAAGDIFVSLSDNIQETFGLTPIEAMAAGLPALVTDWDGYKDTVRDGIDGFRVPTWAPAPGGGSRIARDYQIGEIEYPEYLLRASTAVGADVTALAERLDALVVDPALRRRMGEAGRARARAVYDWPVVFRQHQALWAEQDAVRRRALADPATAAWLGAAPSRSPEALGPFDTFATFPTHHVGPRTVAQLGSICTPQAYRALATQETLVRWHVSPLVVDNLIGCLADGPLSLEALAAKSGIDLLPLIEAAARLAKLDVLVLAQP